MARKTPQRISLRMYQVGFGDCFLLGFHYGGADDRYVLVDFGSTELTRKRMPRSEAFRAYMKGIADDVKARCGGRLHAVVATHRHADHINGFTTKSAPDAPDESGDVIRSCRPRYVLQPWTEQPDLAEDATDLTAPPPAGGPAGFAATLAGMQATAAGAAAEARRLRRGGPVAYLGPIEFMGLDGIANASAVENLAAMGRAKGARALYLHAGSAARLRLPGVKTHVLGPPTLKQSDAIRKQRSADETEFWMLLGATGARFTADGGAPFPGRGCVDGAHVPDHARWLRDRMRAVRAETLHAIVRILDKVLNNTSLILVFETGAARLLLPGDAQIENWQYALGREEYEGLLAETTLYKVGHHGSRNATPRAGLWDHFVHRAGAAEDGGRMWSLVSTMGGKHGTTEATAVPRKTLVDALAKSTNFRTTQDFRRTRVPEYRDFEIDPATGRTREVD